MVASLFQLFIQVEKIFQWWFINYRKRTKMTHSQRARDKHTFYFLLTIQRILQLFAERPVAN